MAFWWDSATNCTYGGEEYESSGGTWTSDSGVVKYGNRSVKISVGDVGFTGAGAIADAGRRITRWIRFSDSTPTAAYQFLELEDLGTSSLFNINIRTDGKIEISDGVSQSKVGTAVLSSNTWYRLALCYVITAANNWQAKIYISSVDGQVESTPDISVSNSDFNLVRVSGVRINFRNSEGDFYMSPAYIDDDTSLNDPGDIRLTIPLFNANSTNTFDTNIGNNPANRYENVNERALSTSNGWRQNGSSAATETFGIETAANCDVDITGKTIIGHAAWCYAARGTFTPATYRSDIAGTGNTTTGGTLVIPSDVITDDILICTVTSQGSTSGSADVTCTDNDSGGNTWAVVTNTSDKKAWMFWKRATSATASKTITIANGVTKTAFNCVVIKDAAKTGNPYTNVSTETNASGDETHAGFTADNEGSLYLLSVYDYGSNNDQTTQATANFGAMTEQCQHSPGGAGADCSNSIATLDGAASVRASTGNITWAQVNSTTYSIVCAIKPDSAALSPTAVLVRNGVDNNITLTGTNTFFSNTAVSATYPSSPFGMKSTGNNMDTLFYEGGPVVVYDEWAGNDIAATASFSVTGSADLDAIGALNAAASLAVTIATLLNATGAFDATAALSLSAAADLEATGSLASASTLAITTSADLDATGTLNAAALAAFTATADLTAAIDDMDAAAVVAITVSATLTASGTLAASAAVAFTTTSADLTAAINNMDASAVLALTAAADLDATGTLQAATAVAITVTSDLDATGALAATATMAVSGTAELDAIGNIAALGTIALISSPDLDATGTLNATASAAISATADLDATGTLDAAADLTLTSTADLTAPASNEMSATAAVSFATSADLDATGNLVAVVPIELSTQAVISAPGKLEAAAALALTVAADVDGALDASATATMVFTTASDLEGAGELRAADTIAFTGTAVLISTGALSGIALMTFTTAAIITDANAGTVPFINNPAATSSSAKRGVNSTSPVRSAVSATVRREVVKTT